MRRMPDAGAFRQGARSALATLGLLAALVAMLRLYRPLNTGPPRWVLRTALDQRIPLVKIMVIPYLSIFPLVLVTLAGLVAVSARLGQSALLASILTLAVSYLFYAFAQTYVARPAVPGDDLPARLLRTVYAQDSPYNAFPSMHTAFAVACAWHWLWLDRRLGAAAAGWAALIVASTVLVHQHYLADVAGGMAVATAASFASRWLVVRLTPLLARPAGALTASMRGD